MRVFIGYDHRQPASFSTLVHSIITKARCPVSITPLVLPTLPLKRQGLTPFTFSRFLVPYLCDYQGWALFLDVDIMLRADIGELFALADDRYAVMVVKNPERRFEWASVMLFNCARCRILTPEYIETAQKLHTIAWMAEDEIGELPPEWNYLVGYDDPAMPDVKLAHFTQGVPAFPETANARFTAEWLVCAQDAFSTAPWATLMGHSVHAAPVRERMRAS